MTDRRDDERRHRRDRWAQVAVLVLAIVAGVVAGLLGTHRDWEHEPVSPTTTTTSALTGPNASVP